MRTILLHRETTRRPRLTPSPHKHHSFHISLWLLSTNTRSMSDDGNDDDDEQMHIRWTSTHLASRTLVRLSHHSPMHSNAFTCTPPSSDFYCNLCIWRRRRRHHRHPLAVVTHCSSSPTCMMIALTTCRSVGAHHTISSYPSTQGAMGKLKHYLHRTHSAPINMCWDQIVVVACMQSRELFFRSIGFRWFVKCRYVWGDFDFRIHCIPLPGSRLEILHSLTSDPLTTEQSQLRCRYGRCSHLGQQ